MIKALNESMTFTSSESGGVESEKYKAILSEWLELSVCTTYSSMWNRPTDAHH